MKKQRVIQYLQNFDEITYDNGYKIDTFHLGQILSHYIKNEAGLTSYQEFNMLLNNTLTLKGCSSVLKLYKEFYFSEYTRIAPDLKDYYPESIIIKEFRSLVELIEIELTEVVTKKQDQLDNYIENLIKEIIQEDAELSKMINHKKSTIFIQSKISNIINLEYKTANELKQVKQVNNTLLEYCKSL